MLKVKGYIHETVRFDGTVRRAHKTFNRYHAFEVGSTYSAGRGTWLSDMSRETLNHQNVPRTFSRGCC